MKRKRMPWVPARSSVDCGPASLATVCQYYGKRVSLSRIRSLAGIDVQGCNLTDLCSAAITLGFDACAGKVLDTRRFSVPVPFIAHINQAPLEHFVVVCSLDESRVLLSDPSVGRSTLNSAEFFKRWGGFAVLLKPGDQFVRSGSWRVCNVVNYAVEVFGSLPALTQVVLGLFALICASALPLLYYSALDSNNEKLYGILSLRFVNLLIAGLILGRFSLSILRHFCIAVSAERLGIRLSIRAMSRLLRLPLSFFEIRRPGEIAGYIGDLENIRHAFADVALSGATDWLLLVLTSLILCLFYPLVGIIGIGCIAFGSVAIISLNPHKLRIDGRVKDVTIKAISTMVETLQNIKIIKLFNAETALSNRIASELKDVIKAVTAQMKLHSMFGEIVACVADIAIAAMVVISLASARIHALSAGYVLFFYTILGIFTSSLNKLSPALSSLSEARIGSERLADIFETEEDPSYSYGLATHPNGMRGDVRFRNISYEYRLGYPVLRDVSFHIPGGSTAVILGPTGSGKSTLISLLAGLYRPSHGDITIDNIVVGPQSVAWVKQSMGVVLQEGGLFDTSILENIRFGRENLGFETIQAAAAQAELDTTIAKLPNGYSFRLSPAGNNLSAGQRQRIAIARALARKPALLILDEATSNLDPETESAIFNRLLELRLGTTTIIVTHKLHIAEIADIVVVIDSGTVVEQGNHTDLLDRHAKYWKMHQACILPPVLNHRGAAT